MIDDNWRKDYDLISSVEMRFFDFCPEWRIGSFLGNHKITRWLKNQLGEANIKPILTDDERSTLKALLGPNGDFLFKVMEARKE